MDAGQTLERRVTAADLASPAQLDTLVLPKAIAPLQMRKEFQALCERMIMNAGYLETFRRRLHAGLLPPQLEALTWYYAFGKPTDHVQKTEKKSVRVVHSFVQPTEEAQAFFRSRREQALGRLRQPEPDTIEAVVTDDPDPLGE